MIFNIDWRSHGNDREAQRTLASSGASARHEALLQVFRQQAEAEKWARDLEAQVDRFGAAPDTKILESTTLGQLLERYQREISPSKCGSVQEIQRLDVLRRHASAYRTMIGLSQQDIASFRDERLQSIAPSIAVRDFAIHSHVLEVAIRD